MCIKSQCSPNKSGGITDKVCMKLSYVMGYEHKKRNQKVRQVRQSEGAGQYDVDSCGDRGARRYGGSGGSEPFGGGGTFCQGFEVGRDASGGLSAGGMIGQLLIEERKRLVGIDDELERLQRGRDAQVSRIEYLEVMALRLKEISDR
jgi:hypothetical protein